MDGAKIVLTNGAIIYYKSMYFVARKVTGEKYYLYVTTAYLLMLGCFYFKNIIGSGQASLNRTKF